MERDTWTSSQDNSIMPRKLSKGLITELRFDSMKFVILLLVPVGLPALLNIGFNCGFTISVRNFSSRNVLKI